MSTLNILLLLLLTLSDSNYPYLEKNFMVPKMFQLYLFVESKKDIFLGSPHIRSNVIVPT